MKLLLLSLLILVLLVVMGGIALSVRSHTALVETGMESGKLKPCPESPNCVCSEAGTDQSHAIDPLKGLDWSRLRSAIQKAGGEISQDDGRYLHATFTSSLFRFVDDVEARLDTQAGVIHLRSASRIGRSDFGANRSRLERIIGDLQHH